MSDTYKKNDGNVGIEGTRFQVDLLILSFLNAIRNFQDWKISTEDKEACKFDDIVVQLSDEAAILIQAKHKLKRSITKEQLLSTNYKNSDFSLPKYFFSYLEIKEKFKKNTVIICTNTDINPRGLENIFDCHVVPSDNILYNEGRNQCFFTLNENIATDLKASAEIYLDKNLQGRNIEKSVINDKNLKDFLRNLQIIANYPSGNELQDVIERLFPLLRCSNLCRGITYHEIYRKVEEWFKQPKGEYLTESRAKAMFCEIKSDKYCDSLKEHDVSFENNRIDFSKSRVFYINCENGRLMSLLRICHDLQNGFTRKLFVNPEDAPEVRKQVVEAFELRYYTFLVIFCASFTDCSEICGKINDILERDKFKKVVIFEECHGVFARQIRAEYVEINGAVTFKDLSKDSQELLLKREIIFQGQIVTLEELLHIKQTDVYIKTLNSSMLEKLVKKERICVGTEASPLDEDATPFYIDRSFERKTNRLRLKNGLFPEESLYKVDDKLILISNGAGMGKSTFLTRLEAAAKIKTPHLWIVRINLNDYTRLLNRKLMKNVRNFNIVELLNSQETTRLTNEFERLAFTVKDKVMLLVDGVDEISPDYTSMVIDLLVQCQKSANFARIFVTTRPHLARDLEEHLKVDCIEMLPFSQDDQVDFLVRYWTRNLRLNDSFKAKCKRYAVTLITKMHLWIKPHAYIQNSSFVGIPLQMRILAEIFQENVRPEEFDDWEGCREYLNGNKSEPKLPGQIDIARLYDMFIDKRQDVFVHKGNPSGNVAANRALIGQFKQCLAYHRYIALEEVLGQRERKTFLCCRNVDDMEDYMLKIGIVQRSEDKFQFIHRTLAEYYVASSIMIDLQLGNDNVDFQKLLIDELLVMSEYRLVRNFLDSFLQKIVDLSSNIFESYRSLVNCRISKENLIILLAREGLVNILQLVLKSIDFKPVRGIEIQLSDDRVKGNNTLNDLQLLVEKAGVNIKSKEGFTALRKAVQGNHLKMIRFLNEQGADFNSTETTGYTVLHEAALMGHLDGVKLLVELGVDINLVDMHNRTPLHVAAMNNYHSIVMYLLECGANTTIRDLDNYTILHLAVRQNWLDIVKRVAVTDDNARTALRLAVEKGNWAIVKYLVERGLNLDFRDTEGRNPLHLAVERGNVEIVKFLIENNADLNLKNDEGNSVLHIAVRRKMSDVLQYLIERGVNVNIRGSEGRTALHLAMFEAPLSTIEYLVDHGADMELPDQAGNTALHLAAFTGKLNAIEYLVRRDSNVHVTDAYGNTALHLAASNGNLDCIEYLVQCGVPVNCKDRNGNTALHLAAFSGRLACVKYLAEHGVDVDIKNNMGETAQRVAETFGHSDIVSYFEQARLGVES